MFFKYPVSVQRYWVWIILYKKIYEENHINL